MNQIVVLENRAGLLEADLPEAIAWDSLSANTQRAYQQVYDKLNVWLMGRPLSDTLLAAYLCELDQAGKSPATISLVATAVKWYLKTTKQEFSFNLTDLRLKTIRRDSKTPGRGQVEGLTWSEVKRVCALAEADKTIVGLRDSALIRLMSDCLLRISEAVAINVEDVDSVLHIRQSKTDQEREGVTLYIGPSTKEAINRYCIEGSIVEGALFRRVRYQKHVCPGRLSVDGARHAIKRRAEEAGFEGFISGHSLRVGSAISLAQAGASVVEMQVAGRWKSPQMPAHYARAELANRGAIARFKYGK